MKPRHRPIKSTPITVRTERSPEFRSRDFYRVSGKAGEHRVFEVEARRCGSAIDPVLEIVKIAKGELLTRDEDAPGIGVGFAHRLHLPA